MTEEEWLSSQNAGTLLQYAKQVCRLSPSIRGRKFRLVAVSFVKDVAGWEADRPVSEIVLAAERYCESGGSLTTFRQLYQSVLPLPEYFMEVQEPLLTTLARALAELDSFQAAYSSAGIFSHRITEESALNTHQGDHVRDIFGNPFRPVAFDPKWRTEHTVGIAAKMYDERDFRAMPILADALEEAGCDNQDILAHCREPGVHVRGCWVVDLVLGKS